MDSSAFFQYPDENQAASVGLLAELHEDEVQTVLQFGQTRRYLPREYAVHEGERDRSLFVILSGRFEVLVPSPRGPQRGADLAAGDIFGELSFFDREPREADVIATSNAEALIMTPEGFERLRLREPRLAMLLVLDLGRVLSTRFRRYNRRLAALGKL
jgi:CRP/FNR family transcriptional regulator, cyclic AMP receptor protein